MSTVTLEFDNSLFGALRLSPDEFGQEMRAAAAVQWYFEGAVSQEKAAELAGLSRIEFLEELRSQFQVVIISDTFYEFATPLMRSLGWPALFCNTLVTDENDMVTGYNLRQQDGKRKAVTALSDLNFKVVAVGDSYNDTTMLQQADLGILFHAGEKVKRDFPSLPTCDDYNDLLTRIRDFEQQRQQEHCRR